jgi:hypothetical protein
MRVLVTDDGRSRPMRARRCGRPKSSETPEELSRERMAHVSAWQPLAKISRSPHRADRISVSLRHAVGRRAHVPRFGAGSQACSVCRDRRRSRLQRLRIGAPKPGGESWPSLTSLRQVVLTWHPPYPEFRRRWEGGRARFSRALSSPANPALRTALNHPPDCPEIQNPLRFFERETGFEPATPSLGSLCSTN